MIKPVINIIKTAAAFLQTGVTPPNTPPDQEQKLANMNHFSSKKFFIAFSGFVILSIFYIFNIIILFNMSGKSDLLTVYPILFTKTIEVFAAIMAVYLGGQAIVDLKYNSNSNTSLETSVNYTEVVVANEKEEDYTLEEPNENV
jgi:hypothetical protein